MCDQANLDLFVILHLYLRNNHHQASNQRPFHTIANEATVYSALKSNLRLVGL